MNEKVLSIIFASCCIGVAIGFVVSILLLVVVIRSYLRDKSRTDYLKFCTDVDFKYDMDIVVDTIIERCFQEYQLTNLFERGDMYINSEQEIEISKDINSLVRQRISPILEEQLKVFYNGDDIYTIIAHRVYWRVTTYVIEHNKNVNLSF